MINGIILKSYNNSCDFTRMVPGLDPKILGKNLILKQCLSGSKFLDWLGNICKAAAGSRNINKTNLLSPHFQTSVRLFKDIF